jgi:hypothetical protein
MTLWCCIEPARWGKSGRVMNALAASYPEAQTCWGLPPDDGQPFVVWGQIWTAAEAIPRALSEGRPFWQVDNGFFDPARGRTNAGTYRLSYRGLSPVLMRPQDIDPSRAATLRPDRPWRMTGKHIVVALPGEGFGRSIGLNMPEWIARTPDLVRAMTSRSVIVRPKDFRRPLSLDLDHAWALVTHSSNVAVDAVRYGIPVFVAPTNPAAPVGNLDLADLETPRMPPRSHWLQSLTCQQFTLDELGDGTAARFMQAISQQVDRERDNAWRSLPTTCAS